MNRLCLLIAAATISAGPLASASSQAQHTYDYTIQHASYGNIGTFSDTVQEDGDVKRIDSKLRVAVRFLGIVVHREEADRTELWRGGRLTAFHSITTVNGKPIEVNGEARADGFVITSPTGTVVAPLDVYPSSPWAAIMPDRAALVMSTKTGKVMPVRASGGEAATVSVNGTAVPVHHYEFVTDKRQDVWLDDSGVPLHFRTEQSGKPIDFILSAHDGKAVARRE